MEGGGDSRRALPSILVVCCSPGWAELGGGPEHRVPKCRTRQGPVLPVFKGTSASANLVPSGQEPDLWHGSPIVKGGLVEFSRVKHESGREIEKNNLS